MNRLTKTIYDGLRERDVFKGDYSAFEATLKDDNVRKKLYRQLAISGILRNRSYDEFTADLGVSPEPDIPYPERVPEGPIYRTPPPLASAIQKRKSIEQEVSDMEKNLHPTERNKWTKLARNMFFPGYAPASAGLAPIHKNFDRDEIISNKLSQALTSAERDALGEHYKAEEQRLRKMAEEEDERLKDIHRKNLEAYDELPWYAKIGGPSYAINTHAADRMNAADPEYRMTEDIIRNLDTAADKYAAPTTFGDEWWITNFGRGIGNVVSDADFLTRGLTEARRQLTELGVKDKMNRILEDAEREGWDEKTLSDKMYDALTDTERRLYASTMELMAAQAARSADTSLGYQAGQALAESAGYMLDFYLSGKLLNASPAFRNMTARALRSLHGRIAKDGGKALSALSRAEKAAYGAGKFGIRAADASAQTALRTAMFPSTYNEVLDNRLEVDEKGRYVNSWASSLANGYTDSFLENLSEMSGPMMTRLLKFGGEGAKAAAKLIASPVLKSKPVRRATEAYARKIRETGLSAAAREKKVLADALAKAGYYGPVEEYMEEVFNAVMMTAKGYITGNEEDKRQFGQFWTFDNNAVLVPTVMLPGAVTSTYNLIANRGAIKAQRQKEKTYSLYPWLRNSDEVNRWNAHELREKVNASTVPQGQDKSQGRIQQVQLTDGRTVYVTQGQLAFNMDNTVDGDNSADGVTVMDAKGRKSVVSTKGNGIRVEKLLSDMPYETEKRYEERQNEREARARYNYSVGKEVRFSDPITGELKTNPDGSPSTGTIIGIGDGVVRIDTHDPSLSDPVMVVSYTDLDAGKWLVPNRDGAEIKMPEGGAYSFTVRNDNGTTTRITVEGVNSDGTAIASLRDKDGNFKGRETMTRAMIEWLEERKVQDTQERGQEQEQQQPVTTEERQPQAREQDAGQQDATRQEPSKSGGVAGGHNMGDTFAFTDEDGDNYVVEITAANPDGTFDVSFTQTNGTHRMTRQSVTADALDALRAQAKEVHGNFDTQQRQEPVMTEERQSADTQDPVQEIADGTVSLMGSVQAAQKAMAHTVAEAQKKLAEVDRKIEAAEVVLTDPKSVKRYKDLQAQAQQLRQTIDSYTAAMERLAQPQAQPTGDTGTQEDATPEDVRPVPLYTEEDPKQGRTRGWRKTVSDIVRRPERVAAAKGGTTRVKFSTDTEQEGVHAVIEADELQPSHRQGVKNPYHFLDEAQPKDREGKDSVAASRKIAAGINPQEITGGVTAYTGSPSVNARGEVIQGNNRADALIYMYANEPEAAARYKQYLVEHADEFGLDAEKVASMSKPVLVNMLDVPDDRAIELGQLTSSDLESGGTQPISPSNVANQLASKGLADRYAGMLLRGEEDESISELVVRNGRDALVFLRNVAGVINDTQYRSALREDGESTPEARVALADILTMQLLGGNKALRTMFGKLPAKAQKAIMATAYRDSQSNEADRMQDEIRASIIAFNSLMEDADFAKATNYEDARRAMEAAKRQMSWDFAANTQAALMQRFSNFALTLAAMYKGSTQRQIQATFNDIYNYVQGTGQMGLFDAEAPRPHSLEEAIRHVLGLDYQPINKQYYGNTRSDNVGGNSPQGEAGGQGSPRDVAIGEQGEAGERPVDGGRGTEGDGRTVSPTPTFLDAVRTIYSKGKEAASKLFSMKFFDVAKTPDFMRELGLRGDRFTIRYGVIARHAGKDGSHTLTEKDWEQLPEALQTPFAITRIKDKDNAYRIYTTLQTGTGEYVVVGADVKNAGKDIEVNAIATVFGRRNNAGITTNEEVVYESKKITPEQSALLKRPNFAQYPTEEELSTDKDTKNPETIQQITDAVEKLGLGVEIITSPSQLPKEEKKAREAIEKGAEVKGWYNAKTGKAYLYLPNAEDAADAVETVLHEVVAHKGLRGMLGKEGFDRLCDEVWDMMDAGQRRRFMAYVTRKRKMTETEFLAAVADGNKRRKAADEYIAHLAESLDTEKLANESAWKRVLEAVRAFLGRMGIGRDANISDESITRLLQDSYRQLRRQKEGGNTENIIKENISKAEAEVNVTPTEAQKKAGNYKKGHVRIDGYDITIEQPKGSTRSGTDENGKTWETKMNNTYGYIRGTQSVDGDHIDVFLSDNPTEGNVYVVDQIDQKTGEFDEHKVMYGFNSMEEAKNAYLSNYSKGWKIGNITEVNKEEFKKWVESSHRKTKPFSEYSSVNKQKQEEKDIKRPSAKIEDVGEKIGGARKDKVKEFAEKEKRVRENKEDVLAEIAQLPVSKMFNFDYDALRKEGVSNEIVTLLQVIKSAIPSKPRTPYKLRRWVSDVFELYHVALKLITLEETGQKKIVERLKGMDVIGQRYTARMALGGYDGGFELGDARLEELGETAGHYDKEGNWVSVKGQWYVTGAGRYDGIYGTKEKAIEALRDFAGLQRKNKGDRKVEFSIYKNRATGKAFITVKGKPQIIVESGFENASDARRYLQEHYADLVRSWSNMKTQTTIGFKEQKPRKGKDWRAGRDVSADEFRATFGFRGVEFGNWANQQERQIALNNAYDALMDLSEATGKSPRAISLNGELGIAFGARGSGRAMAHYEPDKIVINLTKTMGAGTLAHEWWHAMDNYFARMRGQRHKYNTDRTGYSYDRTRGTYSDEERREITDAFKELNTSIELSGYGERSKKYASLKSSYWSRPTELGARAFEAWVNRKLSEKGTINDFLATPPMAWENNGLTETYYPYPIESDFEKLDTAFENLFDTMQEKVDEETGNSALFRIGNEVATAEERSIMDADSRNGTYMKAPNGKPTNLTQKQWVQVRTKAFKQWFGDWEKAAKLRLLDALNPVSVDGISSIGQREAEEIFAKLENGRNKYDGREVVWVKNSVGKIIRHKGFDTSRLIPVIKDVFDASVPIISETEEHKPGHKEHSNFKGYHHYVGKISLNGKDYYVRFTLQEINTRRKDVVPNQLHSAFVSDVEIMSAGNRVYTGNSPATAETSTPVDTKLQSFLEDARTAAENSSKVVDENGEPKVVKHGTPNTFTTFDKARIGSSTDAGWLGSGFYFYGNADEYARQYSHGGNVIEVFLNVRDPYVASYGEMEELAEKNDRDASDDFTARVTDEGYDGVYYNEDLNEEWVVYEPSQIKSATDNTGGFSTENDDIRFRIRTSNPPKKTGIGYKVFVLKNDKLYPPMVANPNGTDTPVGVWLDADSAPIAGQSKTGRKQVKAGGKGTQGGGGKLAYRPGWHLGEIPYALQFNRIDENGNKELFPYNFVWAEVEYANDVDYQDEAMSYGINANGNFQHSLAGLPRIPENGSYRYRTNPNPNTDPWIISGAIKINRLLTPTEVDKIVKSAGREPQRRQKGFITDKYIDFLNAKFSNDTDILFRIADEEAEKTTNELREAADNATYDNAVGDSILPEPPQPKNGMTASEFLKTWQQWKKEAIKADKALVEGYVKEMASNMRWWRRFNKDVVDFARPLENLHLWIKNNGGKINIDNDAYTDLFSSAGRATYKATRFEEGLFNPLKKTITDMCRNISLKQWAKNLKIEVNVLGMPKQVQAKPYDMVTLYLRAKDMLEAEALGMVDRGAQGFMETTGMAASDFVADFEKIFTEKEIDNLWKRINGCTDFTLRTYLDEGMMTQDEYDKYSNRRFYVPQRGWAQNEFAEYVPEYAGMDKYGGNHVFNAALTKAKGRVSLASEPLKYIYSMATSAIVATEKNAVKRKFLKMVRDNSDLGGKSQAFTMRKVWYVRTDSKDETTGKPLFKRVYVRPAQELFDKDRDIYKQISELEIKAVLAKTGTERKGIYERIKELRDEINIHYKNNPQLVSNRPADELEEHVVRVVEDGTEYEIQTKDHQVANVLNRRSKSDKFNSWKKHAGKLTRFFTGMYTRYKPAFAFSNIFRDITGALQTNSVDFGLKYAGKALMNTFTVMPAVAHYAWTGRFTDKKGNELKGSKGKDLRLLQDFFESGAATGFTYLRDIGELEKDLRKEIERGKAAEWTIGKWDAVKKVLSFLTEVSETSVRFAEFKQSLEAGYSKAEAASHAKEVTTNFDRRGAQESVLLQLIVPIYGFFNASVQGVNRYHRLGRGQVLSKGAIRGAMAIARLGFKFYLYGILATMMFPDDPDDERYFSEYERMSNLCLWKLKIPLPHVLRGFYGAGVMTAYWLQDLKSGREAMLQGLQFLLSDLVPAQLDFLTPLEYDEAGRLTYDPNMLGQQLTPTALQAFGDIAFNRDFTGGTVYNKPFVASQDGKTPQTQLGKKDVNSAYQAFTDWLANVSGGSATARTNRDIPYLLDVNPSKIEHVTENFFMPGIIGELAGWIGLIYDAATGNDIDVSKLPLVGRFYRSYNMERYQERLYWKLKKKADRYKYDVNEYGKAKNAGDGNAARLYEDMTTEEKANAYYSARRLLDDLNPDNEGYMPSAEGIRKLQEQTKEWNKIIE